VSNFPQLDKKIIVDIKKWIDNTFREFAGTWGEWFTELLSPVHWSLVYLERLLLATPWYIFLLLASLLIYRISRSYKLVLGFVLSFCSIGLLGMWDDTMRTLSIVSVATFLCIFIGVPIGVLMYYRKRAEQIITPILDLMQTIPSFVYLIPVVMLFGLGKVPGLIAIMIFAIPPVIRFTNLGLKEVDPGVKETADAFGFKWWQKLITIELPLARPTIFGGINQTVMMALAMVIIASMIGVRGLGSQVMNAIGNGYLGLGVISGLSIVAIAIIIDRTIQAYNQRIDWRKHGKN
jgi:glycine betaine/proline transport system permease protein